METEGKPYDDVNVTPMLDLSYVLLIIFILMTTAAVQGTKVDLPRSSQSLNLSEPKTVLVTVNSEGQCFMNTVPVTLEELEYRILAEMAKTPDLPVVVRGDRLTHYQKVMEVLDVLGRVGIYHVGLATQPRS